MKANPEKCHLLTRSSDKVRICVDNYNIKSSKCEKRLAIKINNKLNCDTYIDEICKKAGQKLNAVSRVNPYMVLNQGKCCYMSFGSNPDKSDLILEDSTKIPSAEEYVILGVTIDNRLTFYNHLKSLCKKIANKLNALTRIASNLNHNHSIQLIFQGTA